MKCALAAVVLILGLALGAGAQQSPVKLKVAAVQFRSSFDIEDNRKRIIQALDRLAGEGVQVAVFPECALTGYDKESIGRVTAGQLAEAEEEIRRHCVARRIGAVIGSIYLTKGRAYDTVVVFDSAGKLVERYAKVMLAGEKWATPGNHVSFFHVEGVASTVIICHDERYPELVRLPALAGARIVYYVSHESGMKEESKLAPYRAQMMARAVENGLFVVAANAPANRDLSGSHGQSRIISSDGNILQEASFFGEDTLLQTLTINPGRLTRPIEEGPLAEWWRSGVDWMMRNRNRALE